MKIRNGVLEFNSGDEFIKKSVNDSRIKYYVFNKIKTALSLDIDQVFLFRICLANSDICIKNRKNEWRSILEKCFEYFKNNEDYLKCKECLELINLL